MKNKTNKINKNKAVELIHSTNGKLFTVTFLKKNGTERTINGRLGVSKGVKGTGKNNGIALGYISMYDVQEKGFKMVNSRTITELRTNKTIYNVS